MVREGTPEIWWGFSSTSTNLGAVETFLGGANAIEKRVIFTIDGGSSARDVKRYSDYPREDELMLPCGTAFEVSRPCQFCRPSGEIVCCSVLAQVCGVCARIQPRFGLQVKTTGSPAPNLLLVSLREVDASLLLEAVNPGQVCDVSMPLGRRAPFCPPSVGGGCGPTALQ
jgi:hypothetical protein